MRIAVRIGSGQTWPRVAAKYLFNPLHRPVREEDEIVTAFRDGTVTLRSRRRIEGFTNAVQEIGYQGIRKGDLVIHSMDGFAGAIGVTDSNGKASPVVHAYKPTPAVDARYYAYLLRVLAHTGFITSLAKGIRERSTAFDESTFGALVLPRPPIQSQRAIANFLDRETARIDALIAAKQRMIELLEYRFEAAVYWLVTKGLAPKALQSSGVGWIGDIPTHWTMPPVFANFDVQLGKMLNPAASEGRERYPYLRNQNVQWDRIELADLAEMHFDGEDRKRFELRAGDLLVCEGGEVGRAALWNEELSHCFYQKALHRVRGKRRGDTRFLLYCLRAAASQGVFAVEGNQSTIVHLTAEKLRVHRFPYPSPEERDDIVAELDRVGAWTRSAVRTLNKQVLLLEERRRALTIAAVTGQVDIPGVAV